MRPLRCEDVQTSDAAMSAVAVPRKFDAVIFVLYQPQLLGNMLQDVYRGRFASGPSQHRHATILEAMAAAVYLAADKADLSWKDLARLAGAIAAASRIAEAAKVVGGQ